MSMAQLAYRLSGLLLRQQAGQSALGSGSILINGLNSWIGAASGSLAGCAAAGPPWSCTPPDQNHPFSGNASAARFHTSTGPCGLQAPSLSVQGYTQACEEVSSSTPVDPYAIVQGEVSIVSERLRHSIVSNVPALKQAADYFFRPGVQGKRLRPTLLLLLASSISPQAPSAEELLPDLRPPHEVPLEMRRRQQRIAEIAELIHVASLLHDDVLDDASTRRGVLSLNAQAGNKLAILAGDFLLARASVTLASLHNTEIVELLSRVLEHLVTGEVMQMTARPEALVSLDHYLQKTFCKTASLMANSAQAVALLSGEPPAVAEQAWLYGRHLGMAFQIVDDLLDLTGSSSVLGKPALNDMKSGLATAPVLLAAEEQPGLVALIQRKFKEEGDVAEALRLVHSSSGIARARELAVEHAQLAAQQVKALPPAASAHAELCREALISITEKVLTRTK